MPIETVVIAGGGVAAWLAALALVRKTSCAVTVVDMGGTDDSLGLPLAVEPTLASIANLHDLIGLNTGEVVRMTGSSYTVGHALSNWTESENSAFHPYGEVGASLGAVGFQHLVARLRAENQPVVFANYATAALCAASGRFAPPPPKTRSVLSTLEYGLHLNVAGYRDMLKNEAVAAGVSTRSANVLEPVFDDRDLIAALDLDNGNTLSGDLFLDCTGHSRLLVRTLPDYGFDAWNHFLPGNHVCSRVTSASGPPLPYTHMGAHPNGWQRFAATQTMQEEVLVSNAGAADSYAFTNGRIAKPWSGNCVAIGGAVSVIEPIASTQLHLAGTAIERLLKLFPHDRSAKVEAAEYNRQTIEELENARDFAILHYARNGRFGEAFWDTCRTMSLPERLAHKIALYESCGRVALHDEETFEAWDWISVFDALGIQPRSFDALANAIPKDRIEAHLAQIRNVMLKAVASLPPHQDFLHMGKAAA